MNGDDNPKTLFARKTLAWLKTRLGKLQEAEDLYSAALQDFSSYYGQYHEETLAVALPYADLLFNRFDGDPGPGLEAVGTMYREILLAQIDVNGGSEMNTGCFDTMSRVAGIYETLGDFAAAEAMWRRIINVAETIYGPKAAATITVLHRLAVLIYKEDKRRMPREKVAERNAEALALYRRVLVVWKVAPPFGPVHPQTLKIRVIVSKLYYDMGLHHEAMEFLERALVACERNSALGKDASETMGVAYEAAKMYRRTGDSATAELLMLRVLDWCRHNMKALRMEGNVELIGARVNAELGLVYVDQQRYADGVGILRDALASCERELGHADRETLTVLRGFVRGLLGLVTSGQATTSGRTATVPAALAATALDAARGCLKRAEAVYGPVSHQTLKAVCVVADALVANGGTAEAETLLADTDTRCQRDIGETNLDAADVALKLAELHALAAGMRVDPTDPDGNPTAAAEADATAHSPVPIPAIVVELATRAMHAYTELLGGDHPKTLHASKLYGIQQKRSITPIHILLGGPAPPPPGSPTK